MRQPVRLHPERRNRIDVAERAYDMSGVVDDAERLELDFQPIVAGFPIAEPEIGALCKLIKTTIDREQTIVERCCVVVGGDREADATLLEQEIADRVERQERGRTERQQRHDE